MSATTCGMLQAHLVRAFLFMGNSMSENLVVSPFNDPLIFLGHFSTVHCNILLSQFLLDYKGCAAAIQCCASQPSLGHKVLSLLARNTDAALHIQQ